MEPLYKGEPPRGPRSVVKLAPGIQLNAVEDDRARFLLTVAQAQVHLNEHAWAILELCDGSRSRDRVVVDAMLRGGHGMKTHDVVAFLDAALARGWIVDDDA